MPTRQRFTFAGVNFSAILQQEDRWTVPTPALRKILCSGKVTVYCGHHYTDDYAGDAERNFGRGNKDPQDVASTVTELGKPWLCYFDATEKKIRLCPHQNLAFDITETPT